MRVVTKAPSQFGLKFRVPLWAQDGVQVSLNGEEMAMETTPGTWATIERTWSPDDVVTLTFDLKPRAEPLPGYVSPIAILCGPVVMVQATARQEDGALPATGPLRFPFDYLELRGKVNINPARNLHTNQELRPFYKMNTGEYYRMYFNREGMTHFTSEELNFTGQWDSRGRGKISTEVGGTFVAEFNGSAVVWEGLRHEDAGIAKVKVDGRERGDIDQYGYTSVHVGRMDQRQVPFRWSVADLSPGKHTLEVTVTGRKNSASNGISINVSGLSAYQ